jgi:hypothetical protein
MAYIGKQPAIGNFVKLDAITTSSTNTYNLTVDSVAFVPESANHMLVSLNGVIQAPLSSFSVSGSTITFIPSSGTLSSSDSIDFIMVYGNVLDIGTPSDSTVTNAKTNFVSTSSSAGLQIKGDGTTDGTLQLNCSQNSHGIKLKSPPHSAGASYTLTFPNNDGDANQFLKTDGSGVLSFADAGGGASDGFHAYDMISNASGDLVLSTELFDDGGNYNTSNGRYTAPSNGKYLFNAGATPQSTTANVIFKKNGSDFAGGGDMFGYSNNNSTQGMAHLIVNLSAGDYINLNTNNNAYNNYIFFNGVKLY